MRNPLNKRIFRSILKNKSRYIAISIMMIVSISVVSAFLLVANGVHISFYKNRITSKVEDGQFTSYFKIDKNDRKKIEKDNGIKVYKNYYTNKNVLNNSTLRIYSDRNKINLPTYFSGRKPKNNNEVTLDRLFAKSNNLNVGDKLKIGNKNYKIVGLVATPDYSSLFKNNSDLMMDSFKFGVGFVSDNSFKKISKNHTKYVYSYTFNKRNLDKNEKLKKNNQIMKNISKSNIILTDFLSAKNNQSISFLEEDLGSDVPMMKVLLSIIILIMAFVFIVIISHTIEEEAGTIGTLLASGYTKLSLIIHYILTPIFVTLFSAIVGNVLAYTIMPKAFLNMYYTSYSLPPINLQFNLEALLLTTLLPITIMLVINFIYLQYKLNISPLNFLRSDLKRNKTSKMIKLPNFKFITRYKIRVILQNKGSFITLFVGMFLAGLILMFGLCIKPMINNYISNIKEDVFSNYQYVLKEQVNLKNKKDSEKYTFSSLDTYYKYGKKDISISFYGINKTSKYVNINFKNNKDKVYISSAYANKFKTKIGDKIKYKDTYKDKTYTLTVSGIYPYKTGFAVFMDRNTLNKMLKYDKNYYNGYFSNKKLDIQNKYIATTITKDDIVALGKQMLTSFNQMGFICLIVSIIIYLVLIYILTKLIIEKNGTNISFMKVLGYNNKDLKNIYISSIKIGTILSIIFSLPFIAIGIKLAMELMCVKLNGYIEMYTPLYLYFQVFLIGTITYLVINTVHTHNLNKIDMGKALKNRE